MTRTEIKKESEIDSLLKYISYAGIFLVTLTPAIVSSSLFFPFISGKGFFFRIVVEIVFASYLILAVRNPDYRPKKNILTALVFAFTIIILLADLFGVHVNRSLWSNFERMEGFVMIAHLALFFIAASSLLKDKLWNYWMNTSIVISALVMSYGFFQLFGLVQLHQSSTRIESTLGNSAYFAVYMLLNLGFALYLFVKNGTSKVAKYIYLLLSVLYVVMIYFSGTRGTALGLFVAAFIGGIFFLIKEKEDKKTKKIIAGLLAALIIMVGSFIAIKDSNFVKNNTVLSRFSSISLTDKSQARAFIWPMAINGFKENPILGWGQENFNYIFNKYYNSNMWMHEQWFDRAHNVFLDWLVAGGILGFLAYISLYLYSIKLIWKGDFTIKEKSVLIALLFGYAVHNVFVFDNISSYILFFGILAFLASKQNSNRLLPDFKIQKDFNELVVIPGIILILIWSLYYVNIKPIGANQKLISALQPQKNGLESTLTKYTELLKYIPIAGQESREQMVINSETIIRAVQDAKTQNAFFDLAKKAAEGQIAYSPNDARAYLFAGGLYSRLGQVDLAEPMLIKAAELTPNKQAPLFDLTTVYLNKGDKENSIKYAKAAYDMSPEYPDAISIYSSVLAYFDDFKTSLEVSIKDPSIILDNRLVNILIQKKQYKNIIAMYESYIEKNPSDPKIIQIKGSLAATYLANGEVNRSISYIEQMAKDYPEFKPQSEQLIKDIRAGKKLLN